MEHYLMGYYLSQRDQDQLRPIVQRILSRESLFISSNNPKRLQYLLRNGLSGKYFPEVPGVWRVKIKKHGVLLQRLDTQSDFLDDVCVVRDRASIDDVLNYLATVPVAKFEFQDAPITELDLKLIPTTFTYEYDPLFATLTLQRISNDSDSI